MLFCQQWKYHKSILEVMWMDWVFDEGILEDLWADWNNAMNNTETEGVYGEDDLKEGPLRPTKYPNFRVATGGKGPPEEPIENWLSEYVVGTTFVSMKRNNKDGDFELFHLLFKSLPDVVLLKWELCDGKLLDKYVDPVIFSKVFKPGVILGIIKPEASEEDTDNGNSNRSDRPRDLVLHEAVPGEHQLPED